MPVQSPPVSQVDLQGASRTHGGLFRGHAHGNRPNRADLEDMETDLIPISGKVYVYVTASTDPAAWDISSLSRQVIRMSVNNSLATVLRAIGDKHSPPHRKYQIFVYKRISNISLLRSK